MASAMAITRAATSTKIVTVDWLSSISIVLDEVGGRTDLAVFKWQATGLAGLNYTGNEEASRQWDAFLEGYCRVRTLTAAELAATHIFVPIRRIWWMGMHTRLAQTVGPSPVPNLAGLDRDAQTAWFDQHIGLIRRNIDQL